MEMKIGIRLHPATDDPSKRGVSFKTMCPDCDVPVDWQGYECPECGKEINHYSHGNAGYEVGDDEYIILDRKEIDKIKKKRSKNVPILNFIPSRAMEKRKELLVGRTYIASPQEGSVKRYQWIAESLGHDWGIAKIVFSSGAETLVGFTTEIIETDGELVPILLFRELAYEKEKRELPDKLKDANWKELDEEELEYAGKMIDRFMADSVEEALDFLSNIKDEYTEDLENLIDKRLSGETVEIEVPEEEEKEEDDEELLKALAGEE